MGIEEAVRKEIIRPWVAQEFREGRNPLLDVISAARVDGNRIYGNTCFGHFSKPVILCLGTGRVAMQVESDHEFSRIPYKYMQCFVASLGLYGFDGFMPCHSDLEVERFMGSK